MGVFVERREIKTHRFHPGNSARPDIEPALLIIGITVLTLAGLSIYHDVIILYVPVEVVPNPTHPVPFPRGWFTTSFRDSYLYGVLQRGLV